MFDIGFSELFVVALVALVVLGPERLPKAARFAGLWVRRARAQWYSVKAELENELAADELKRSLQATQAELREARDSLQRQGQALRDSVEGDGSDSGHGADATPAGGNEPPQPAADANDNPPR
ncbi:twin-arginine translocase subunit TatB [Lysobacter psychrotolerans]|uniref:Sec-independent protein translocase protein TatB n=1 Tax=Montanilutibacter psychrotolerans TaxID=1327343 RepID=A0A3M8SWD4_9GAMM|nr:twin-arginine translocase subunit TatB [Lysobacter psychrotolerans]